MLAHVSVTLVAKLDAAKTTGLGLVAFDSSDSIGGYQLVFFWAEFTWWHDQLSEY